MTKIWVITKRELYSYFDSLIAYVIIILFLGLTGFFTWLASNNVFFYGQATMQPFFQVCFLTLLLLVPAITMRTLAEENRACTIELLSTKAVSDWQIVMGKFLSSLIIVLIGLACTIPYYITISSLGNIDHGAVWGGYIGLTLLAAAFISLGIFSSSITNNQIVALLLAIAFGLVFLLLFSIIGSGLTGTAGEILTYFSAQNHFNSMSRGVIDSRDILYFVSIILLGLIFSQSMLSKRNWHN
jgi:ABC-2 type transport system permease protein